MKLAELLQLEGALKESISNHRQKIENESVVTFFRGEEFTQTGEIELELEYLHQESMCLINLQVIRRQINSEVTVKLDFEIEGVFADEEGRITLEQAIALYGIYKQLHEVYTELASRKQVDRRTSYSENASYVYANYGVKSAKKELNRIKRRLLKLDALIQSTNWSVDVDDSALSSILQNPVLEKFIGKSDEDDLDSTAVFGSEPLETESQETAGQN